MFHCRSSVVLVLLFTLLQLASSSSLLGFGARALVLSRGFRGGYRATANRAKRTVRETASSSTGVGVVGMSKYKSSTAPAVREGVLNSKSSTARDMGFSSAEFSDKFSVGDPVVDREAARARSPFVCGTGSASRRLILENAGYEFVVIKADIDERALGNRSDGSFANASRLVMQLGHAKADAVMTVLRERQGAREKEEGAAATATATALQEGKEGIKEPTVLLTADQVVTCNGRILEKPLNEEEAREMLGLYGQHNCSTVGSLVLTNILTGQRVERLDSATIHFRSLSEEAKEALIAEGMIYHCAGALMIEHELVLPYIDRVEGSEESVMGLNSSLLQEAFRELEGL